VVATANPFCDLPWVRRGRMSFKAEILPKAHDEKNARHGYQLSVWGVVATANPFCDLPWVRRGRMSFKAEILQKSPRREERSSWLPDGPRCPQGLSHFVAPTFRSALSW